jgi:hypothetical protein
MSKRTYHLPVSSRPICPVCKKAAYSRGGIHPQCAMIRPEPPEPPRTAPPAAEDGPPPEPPIR